MDDSDDKFKILWFVCVAVSLLVIGVFFMSDVSVFVHLVALTAFSIVGIVMVWLTTKIDV